MGVGSKDQKKNLGGSKRIGSPSIETLGNNHLFNPSQHAVGLGIGEGLVGFVDQLAAKVLFDTRQSGYSGLHYSQLDGNLTTAQHKSTVDLPIS